MATNRIADPEVSPEEYVTSRDIMQYFQMSRTLFEGLIHCGAFPAPVRFDNRYRRWKKADVKAYERSRYRQAEENLPNAA